MADRTLLFLGLELMSFFSNIKLFGDKNTVSFGGEAMDMLNSSLHLD